MSPSADNSIRLWELESGAVLRSFTGHTDGVTSIALSPDGGHLLSGSIDRSVRLWDLETGHEIRRLVGHGSYVTDVAFSSDGRTGVSSAAFDNILVWDLEGGTFDLSLASGGEVFALAISPDGERALSAGSGESPVYVWDLLTGQEAGRFLGQMGRDLRIDALSTIPDGRLALSGDSTGILILWEIASGDEIRRLSGHSDPIAAISVSVDGRRAFTCDEGGTSILWDLESQTSIGRFSAPGAERIGACALSPDGRMGAVGLGKEIMLWQLEVPTLEELLLWIEANRYVRELTCEERELYRIPPFCDTR